MLNSLVCGVTSSPVPPGQSPVRYTEKVDCWSAGVIMCLTPTTLTRNDDPKRHIFRSLERYWRVWKPVEASRTSHFRLSFLLANLMHLLTGLFLEVFIFQSLRCAEFIFWFGRYILLSGMFPFKEESWLQKNFTVSRSDPQKWWCGTNEMKMGVSNNMGTPKWMVKIMENPIKHGWFGGKTPIFGNTQMNILFSNTPPCHRWFLGQDRRLHPTKRCTFKPTQVGGDPMEIHHGEEWFPTFRKYTNTLDLFWYGDPQKVGPFNFWLYKRVNRSLQFFSFSCFVCKIHHLCLKSIST